MPWYGAMIRVVVTVASTTPFVRYVPAIRPSFQRHIYTKPGNHLSRTLLPRTMTYKIDIYLHNILPHLMLSHAQAGIL